MTVKALTAPRLLKAWRLAGLLFSIYVLTMSGHISSGDERLILDSVDSVVNRGDLYLNQTIDMGGFQTTPVEPITYLLPVPLYWMVYQLPFVGNVHGFFLLTPLLTALTSAVLFLFLLDLGYTERHATLGTLLFGLATIVWPYSKTIFREPLVMLLILVAVYCFNRWRAKQGWGWAIAGGVFAVIGLLGKEAMFLALPLIVAFALPSLELNRWQLLRGLLVIGGILLTVFGLLALYATLLDTPLSRYDFAARLTGFNRNAAIIPLGLRGFLLSPGKSVWMFSPPLLLMLASPFVSKRWRETWLPLGMLLLFGVIYAGVRGPVWHGGLGWGPRYLVPLTPILFVGAMPTLAYLLERPWGRIMVAALSLSGIIVQLVGLYFPWDAYSAYLLAETGQAPWERLGLWNLYWVQPVATLRLFGQVQPDVLWLHGGLRPSAVVVMLVLIGGWAGFRRIPPKYTGTGLALALVVTTVGVLYALSTAWDDPRYQGQRTELHTMLGALESQLREDDIIILTTEGYIPFFTNYYKGDHFWFSAPLSPGERYSCEQVPEVTSTSVEEQLSDVTSHLITEIRFGERPVQGQPLPGIWFVEDIPLHPCATRPTIRYAALRGYLGTVEEFAPNIRLIQWNPLPFHPVEDNPLDVRFGDSIALREAYIRSKGENTVFTPNEMLGVGLRWETLNDLEENYTVVVFMQAADGYVIQQLDRWPQGGFEPTSTWPPGEIIRDNYGFIVPETLPPGEYTISVAMYRWPSLERLTVTQADTLSDAYTVGTFTVETKQAASE